MAYVTALTDHGTYWTITYDDNTTSDVIKDPNALDAQAALQRTLHNDAVAAQLQAWANHMRKDGKPVDVPMSTNSAILLVLGITLAGYFLVRKAL